MTLNNTIYKFSLQSFAFLNQKCLRSYFSSFWGQVGPTLTATFKRNLFSLVPSPANQLTTSIEQRGMSGSDTNNHIGTQSQSSQAQHLATTCTMFPKFKELPCEIREQIWEASFKPGFISVSGLSIFFRHSVSQKILANSNPLIFYSYVAKRLNTIRRTLLRSSTLCRAILASVTCKQQDCPLPPS
jgi:hypothetical protein